MTGKGFLAAANGRPAESGRRFGAASGRMERLDKANA